MKSTTPQLPEQWIRIARILRPQGRHGEVLAEIFTDFPDRFSTTRNAFLTNNEGSSPIPAAIERSWLHQGRVVLKFAGTDSISSAETLRGAEVVIPASERVSLEPEATYIDNLIGCQLVDTSPAQPQIIGTIEDIIRQENTPDLLVVRSANGQEHWIPFAKAYQVSIDLEARQVEMSLPSGLLEINRPLSEEERAQQNRPSDTAQES